MKYLTLTLVSVSLAMTTLPAQASSALAMSKACAGCHAADKKLVGPSYADISAKYANQKGADSLLAEKMMKGGTGVWGTAVMPPNASLSPTEAQTLAKWILSGAK